MSFNYNKLRGKIVEVFGTLAAFAEAMQWSMRTCSLHMTGKIAWKQSDILRAAKLLGIPDSKIHIYFFVVKVQEFEHEE